jgi:hypothetical protein
MGIKRHKPEEIVTKLRQVEVLAGQGMARVDTDPPPLSWSTLIVSKGGLSYGYQTTQTPRDRHQVTLS